MQQLLERLVRPGSAVGQYASLVVYDEFFDRVDRVLKATETLSGVDRTEARNLRLRGMPLPAELLPAPEAPAPSVPVAVAAPACAADVATAPGLETQDGPAAAAAAVTPLFPPAAEEERPAPAEAAAAVAAAPAPASPTPAPAPEAVAAPPAPAAPAPAPAPKVPEQLTLQVTVDVDLGLVATVKVDKGSTLAALKDQLGATDVFGLVKPEDVALGVLGSGVPLGDATVLDGSILELELIE